MENNMSMYLNQYQVKAKETAIYKDDMYPIVSLMVEAAEFADLFIKPRLRGDETIPKRDDVIGEAGDVLWNLAVCLSDLGIDLSEVASTNLKKLDDRKKRGVLTGRGGKR
jgi:NTP pyrophosphatase (non-canonical NTP hydrolase)